MTTPPEIHKTAIAALEIYRLYRTRDTDNRTVIDRIHDARNGNLTAAIYDGDRITATGTSDPTAHAAMRPDLAAQHLYELRTTMTAAHRNLTRVLAILDTYTPRPPTDLERQRMADANEPHCESCARTEVANGIPRWEPPLTQERSTVAGSLTEPAWLCRWCYDHVAQTGLKPTVEELEQHHSGQRVRCPHPRNETVRTDG